LQDCTTWEHQMCLIETTMSSFMFFFGNKALPYGLMHDKGPTFNEKAVMN
jgi:hypothetical protein